MSIAIGIGLPLEFSKDGAIVGSGGGITAYILDEDGNPILDEDGNPIPIEE